MSVTFTVSRSVLAGHQVGDSVSFDIRITEAIRDRIPERSEQRSLGGATEMRRHRADVFWDVTFEPVFGYKLLELREFLDSVENGELFSIYLYDTESEPLTVKRMDRSSKETPFQRRGAEEKDAFQVSIRVLVVE